MGQGYSWAHVVKVATELFKKMTTTQRFAYKLERFDNGLQALLVGTALQIAGHKISRVRNSIGSALLIDIGSLSTSIQSGKPRSFGEWHIFVEMAEWTVVRSANRLASSKSDRSAIAEATLTLSDQKISWMAISVDGSIEAKFENGVVLNILNGHDAEHTHNWTIFFRDIWTLSSEGDSFSFCSFDPESLNG